MNIKFQKYQGTGNDFIIIDNRQGLYELSRDIVRLLCDRKFGIGADGLMLLEQCEQTDFRMRYFNADGGEATLCGNGSRCIVDFAYRLGLFEQTTRFMAADGEHEGQMTKNGVKVKMHDVKDILVTPEYSYLNTGSPHYVKIVEDAFQIEVVKEGRKIRYSTAFAPEGTNVNFITPTDNYLKVATYERGVENETLACGTGCVASALTLALRNRDTKNVYHIQTKGGKLKVSFERRPDNSFTNIWLEGPAEKVFTGEIEIRLSPSC